MLDEYCFLVEDNCEKNRGGINEAIFYLFYYFIYFIFLKNVVIVEKLYKKISEKISMVKKYIFFLASC